MTLRTLFDPGKDIYRTIEKVITYKAAQAHRLKAEIAEYVVTASIEEQLEKLLDKMQLAMETGGQNEVGVWVSGFYGSGKSSFTKYLGLAFDEQVTIDGQPFLKHLQDRLHKPTTRALLATVVKRFPAAVVLLDLASEMLAGATMEDVSTVLYYKVLHWAGYSQNLKVAALERRLKKDGRYPRFLDKIQAATGLDWRDIQNDPLVVDSLIPDIAHQLYPELFKTATAFSTTTGDFFHFETQRVEEMIELVREASGKAYILFVIDEVGQYVGGRPNLILNLDGLAKNLKNSGDGKVWIIGTAQQTLTEDDPRAALNSPELYKLKDRFPIQVELESSDIKEICYRRLLGKSAAGAAALGVLFDRHGQSLRHHTRLQDARYYEADFNRESFINLYPFLPAHFDILLHLLGALAKSTGGIGLRSAIKVIQDILVEDIDGRPPVADRPVGWLATTVTLYDALDKDIQRAYPSIHQAVGKTLIRCPDNPLQQDIAKSIAVLQILGNLPVTVQNVAGLLHPAVDAPSRAEAIHQAVATLLADPLTPLGEKGNQLCFFSEKLNDIEQERVQIPLRAADTHRIFNDALRELFNPLPSARLHGSLVVTSGVKAQAGPTTFTLAGERETIQTVVEFVESADYDDARTRLLDESRRRPSEHTIYLLGRRAPEADDWVAEIYRAQRIVDLHRHDPDPEIRDYCASQTDRAARLALELQHGLRQRLLQGSFLFRGQTTAVDSLDPTLAEAGKKHLARAADQVFDRYSEAPARAETSLAERFLRTGNLKGITAQLDPLALVQLTAGTPGIRRDHKALVSLRDYLDRNGTVEGKRLLEHFGGAPFGWSPDTLRYLVAALLLAGDIKLKVAGREVTVNGQQAIDALKTNQAFKAVGVALRQDKPSLEVLARAAQRLTDLSGDSVVPLEEDISKAAARYLLQCQHQFAPLAEKLERLDLPGVERTRTLNQAMADLLLTDASDAPPRFGGEESVLYEDLKWAQAVKRGLDQGLETTLQALRRHQQVLAALPACGIPGKLRHDLTDDLERVAERLSREDFYQHAADLNTMLTTVQARVAAAVSAMADDQDRRLKAAVEDLKRYPEWSELTQEARNNVLAQVETLTLATDTDLAGLERLITHEFDIQSRLGDLKQRILQEGRERRRQRAEEMRQKHIQEGKRSQAIKVPVTVYSMAELDDLIGQLQALKADLAYVEAFELHLLQE
ncbi:MAG: BREX system P-loop protein BrxC [Candidatus Competibacteraceae bacterium]